MDTRLTTRTFTELQRLPTLLERFDYLELSGQVGDSTFGSDRWINQQFYRSREWKQTRDFVLVRDLGYDLGAKDAPIAGVPRIHHMNPLTLEDIEEGTDNLMNPEFLITTSLRTHNAIHFGDKSQVPQPFVERRPGDTRSW